MTEGPSANSRARPAEIIVDVTEAVEGGYDARALGYNIYTQGENWDDLKEMARDAVLCHFGEDAAARELRARRLGHRAHLRHVPRLRGDRGEQDLRQRCLRLLEGDRRAPLRIDGTDPNRVYEATEITELKGTGKRSEDASAIIQKIHERGTEANPPRGLFADTVDGRAAVVGYEPDADLRGTEQIPLQEEGGIEAFLRREVLPYASDAWYQADRVKTGYETSFTRDFTKPKPMRTLAEIQTDSLAPERESEGLLGEIIEGTTR